MAMTWFEKSALQVTRLLGHFWTFLAALAVILLWLASGPFFGWSDSWQLVVNTVTTVITFLMVFVIQGSQNRDSLAVRLKLDELVAATRGASGRVILLDELSEDDLRRLLAKYRRLPPDRDSRSIEDT